MAVLMELGDMNAFKTKAIQNGARVLDKASISLEDAAADATRATQAGLGKGIQEILREFVSTGAVAEHQRLKTLIPEGVFSLTKLRGVGAKKAKALHEHLGINSIGELEQACRENRLLELKSFGAKTQAAVLVAIETWNSAQGRLLLHRATAMAEELRQECLHHGAVRVERSGELARWCEVINEICLVCQSSDSATLCAHFGVAADTQEINVLRDGMRVRIIVCGEDTFERELFRSSCAADFLRAFEQEFSVPGGLDRAGIFAHNKLSVVSPELCEDPSILQRAAEHDLPELVENRHMKGMLHIHTHWSDGVHSLREMALEAKDLGFEYIAVCDHSKTAFYANGLSVDRVLMQHEEIDKLNAENLGIRILKGIESDILSDGSLDYEEDILQRFDMVVASVHSAFSLAKEVQTQRIINAIRSPYTTIVGHPTGRLLLSRKGYELNIEAILEAAADTGTVIELNANPHRLDLDWRFHQRAVDLGVKIAINPDSHQCAALKEVFIGVGVARKGMLRPSDVLNTLSLSEFQNFCADLRVRKSSMN